MRFRTTLGWVIGHAAMLLGSGTGVNVLADGGIVTDGRVGGAGALGKAQALSGKEVEIQENLGTRAGKNLFHSFSSFNVNRGQTVTFTETETGSLDNVIARVTGSSRSDIDGTLRSTPGGRANFYLINPQGVAFGEKATVDVPGAFHVSTADNLKFKDGARYSATAPNGSTFSSAAPAAFGFLGSSRANNAFLTVSGTQLAVKTGQTLDGVAGNIQISSTKGSSTNVSAPGGEIRLVAIRGQADVSLPRTADGHLPLPKALPTQKNAGTMAIDDSTVVASSNGSGRIGLWGGGSG